MRKHVKKELLWLCGLAALGLYATKNRSAALVPLSVAALLLIRKNDSVDLKGRSAVVTGGSRGLGLALAQELLKQGANVTLLARDLKELQRAENLLLQLQKGRSEKSAVLIQVCDVTREEQVQSAMEKVVKVFGGIDLLINNAGSIVVGPWETMELEDFQAQFNLHVFAPIITTRAALPYLRKENSAKRIVNICSMGGKIAVPHMLTYDTSKFALAGFSQGVGAELSKEGISVTTVYPAVMRTGSPIQAVFKGDHEKEFAWFQTGDILPFLSASAEGTARRVIRAARERQEELLPSLPAKARMMVGAFFPELMAQSMSFLNSKMPSSHLTEESKEYKTGAQSRKLFEESPWTKPFVERARKPERNLNQHAKNDARFNMGLPDQSPGKAMN